VDLHKRQVWRIKRRVIFASVFFKAQLVLKMRRFRQGFYVVADCKGDNSFVIRFFTVRSVIGEEQNFDFLRVSLFLTLLQVIFIPSCGFAYSAIVSIIRRFFWQSLDISVAENYTILNKTNFE
jgi:hypothetical protein